MALTRQPTPPDSVLNTGTSRRPMIVFGVLAAVAAFLTFADGAPAVARGALRAAANAIGPIEDLTGLRLPDRREVPFDWDVIGHAGLWFSIAFAGWWAFRNRATVGTLMCGLFTASYASEIGQAYLSATRTPDPRDLLANALGIVTGLLAGAVIGGLSVAARRLRRSEHARSRS